jgi:hypothetical protein
MAKLRCSGLSNLSLFLLTIVVPKCPICALTFLGLSALFSSYVFSYIRIGIFMIAACSFGYLVFRMWRGGAHILFFLGLLGFAITSAAMIVGAPRLLACIGALIICAASLIFQFDRQTIRCKSCL